MELTVFGIKNCDTMKKAMKWLDDNGVAYHFHDYKKDEDHQTRHGQPRRRGPTRSPAWSSRW